MSTSKNYTCPVLWGEEANTQFALSMQAKFTITKLHREVNLLECEGIGLENKNL